VLRRYRLARLADLDRATAQTIRRTVRRYERDRPVERFSVSQSSAYVALAGERRGVDDLTSLYSAPWMTGGSDVRSHRGDRDMCHRAVERHEDLAGGQRQQDGATGPSPRCRSGDAHVGSSVAITRGAVARRRRQ
jgi:hypothetical protein